MSDSQSPPSPPSAPVRPHALTAHGTSWADDFFWLRDRHDPAVLEYLKAENAYAEAVTAHTAALQKTIYREMRERIQESDLTVPYRWGGYLYYTRTEEGQQYPIYCRREGDETAVEQVMIDANALAAGHDYFNIGILEPSPDHRLLAFSTDTAGNERYTLQVKDLHSGELLPDQIPNTYYSVAWASDNQTLFYTTLDEAHRSYRLYRHRLGDDVADDVLVYQEDDDRYRVSISRSNSGAYLILSLNSPQSSEVHLLPATDADGSFQIVRRRRSRVEYMVEHHGDHLYILTNADDAVNFKLMRAPVAAPDRWEPYIPYRPEVRLESLLAFRRHLVLLEREGGQRYVAVLALPGRQPARIEFPEDVYTVWPGRNEAFDNPDLRLHYTSLVTPETVYDYNLADGRLALRKQTPVLGGYDAAKYETMRLFATTSDGAAVPISLVYRRDRRADGPQPLLVYGYGAYGYPADPKFSSSRISLLDRGLIFAIAHIRGGGEMGRPWYEAGKFLHKKNSFDDFIACAETLIAEGYTSPEQLVALGGSAGGLLMGAVLNQRPDLFRAVVAHVPFVDVVNTMLDASIPLTVPEYEEWGDPNDKTYFEYMRSYSPYDNVREQAYPALLVTAGLSDPRVQYWEPAKWVARLRQKKKDDNRLILKTNLSAGHVGASGRFDRLEELAFDYVFILDQLGIAE